MGIMDLTINQEAMGVQSKFGNHVFQLKEYNETDVKGNNNFYNSRKTDTSNDPSSLFRDGYSSENLHVDPSLFSYSSFKKAMDLRTHNRRDDENTRTIFDDADYFAKNFFYKLLPITFEQVDETIIQSEHNYSLCSLNSESEAEEDCSRTMDYSQIKEKNYKRRRTKFRDESDDEQREEEWDENEVRFDSNQNIPNQKECPEPEPDLENAMQPLDLSAAPPVQEQKTDHNNCQLKEDSDSVEDNLHSKLNWIQVTITRPDEKENYQPCEMFLNDIARLVPRLINNDCFEIDILDKTGHPHDDLHTHRLYYIIAQSTWRLFQSTSERVILTNDYTIGPPVKKIEKDERPTFLVFDQFSLAKCLAEYCQEIGGCFEYTCVEEGKENEGEEVVKSRKMVEVKTEGCEKADEKEEMTEMVPKETTVEIDTKVKTQIDEMNTKSEEVAKEIIHVSEDLKMDIEDKSMENKNAILKINLDETEARSDLTAIKSGDFVADKKAQEISVGEIKNSNLERNETEENVKEIKMSLSDSLEPKESETNENRKKQRKVAVRNKKKKGKVKISTEDVQSSEVESEVKNINVEEDIKTEAKKEALILTHVENSEPDNIDAKEGESIETNTTVNISESTEAKAEINIENEHENEKNTKGTKEEDIEMKENNLIVEKTKSDEENENTVQNEKAKEKEENIDNKMIVDVQMKKQRGKKVIKKRKKEVKEREADAECAENAKKDVKEKEIEFETTKVKEAETNSKGKKTNNVSAKSRKESNLKTAKRKPLEETKKSESLEAKNKEKRPEVEKAKNSPPQKTRSKIKPKNDPPLSQPQIKTRSKSTSESETSQKPNKEIKKTKNTVKETQKEVKEVKESTERKTRSGKVMAEKKEDVKVKENGMKVRGKKRKPEEEEEVLEERRLRSRGEKNVEKVNIPSKRRKR